MCLQVHETMAGTLEALLILAYFPIYRHSEYLGQMWIYFSLFFCILRGSMGRWELDVSVLQA